MPEIKLQEIFMTTTTSAAWNVPSYKGPFRTRFVTWFKDRPKDARRDRHHTPPTMPIPWGQRPVK